MSTTTMDFAELFAGAQKQALASIKHWQDASLRATKVAASLIPAERITVPGFPAPRTIVENSFAFAGEVLELQRAYALELVDIAAKGEGTKKTADTAAK